MSRLKIDAETLAKLGGLREPLELVDASGRCIGRVIPVPSAADYEPWQPPPLSEAEVRELLGDGTGLTTAEMLAHLEKLAV